MAAGRRQSRHNQLQVRAGKEPGGDRPLQRGNETILHRPSCDEAEEERHYPRPS